MAYLSGRIGMDIASVFLRSRRLLNPNFNRSPPRYASKVLSRSKGKSNSLSLYLL